MKNLIALILLFSFIPSTCFSWGIVSISGFGTTGPVSYDGADNASTTNAVPAMTSNTAPSGTVSASAEVVGNEPYRAFDRAYHATWVPTIGVTTGWLQYQFGAAKLVNKYTITPWVTTRICKDWTLEGSNNGSDWTVLDTQTGVTAWSTDTKKTFTFVVTADQTYTYFKLDITANNGDANILQIDEVELIVQAI